MSSADASAEALARLEDRLEAEGIDPGSDPLETIDRACERSEDTLVSVLSSLIASQATEDERHGMEEIEPAAAMEELYVAIDERGSQLLTTIPDTVWEIVAVATTVQDADTQAGVYARALLFAMPFTGQHEWQLNDALSVSDVLTRLESPATAKAVAMLCARHGIPGTDDEAHAKELVQALAEKLDAEDTSLRALAAKSFDYSSQFDPEPVVADLLAASDDPDPAVRAAAVGALCHRLWLRDDVPDWADDAMKALASAFDDEHIRVRTRAAGVLDCYPSHLTESELWRKELNPETRGRLILNARDVEIQRGSQTSTWNPRCGFGPIVADDVWTHLDEFRRAGWGDDVDEAMRRKVTEAIEAAPEEVSDPDWYVERIDSDYLEHDARIMRALTPEYPDVTSEVAATLERGFIETREREKDVEIGERLNLDGGREKLEIGRALAVLTEHRPDAVSLSHDDLVSGMPDIVQNGDIRQRQFVAMADVDPDITADTLVTVCRQSEEYNTTTVASTINSLGNQHPSIIAEAIDEIFDFIPECTRYDKSRVFRGITAVGEHDPAAIAPHTVVVADALVEQNAAYDNANREGLEDSLWTLAKIDSEVVREAIRSEYSDASDFLERGRDDAREQRRELLSYLDMGPVNETKSVNETGSDTTEESDTEATEKTESDGEPSLVDTLRRLFF